MKRLIDLIVVLVLAPLWLPVLMIVAALVRLRLGSPVLFRQERPGLRGCSFSIFKFRTMTDARDANGVALPDEQRLTPFGNFLRSTSLDELPSMFNLLKGDMTLVGPRPLLSSYLPLYSADQARRHEVKPGITGWAQVRGRNALAWDDKLALDTWYVDHRSLLLDLRILATTAVKVVRRADINQEGSATTPPFTGSGGPPRS